MSVNTSGRAPTKRASIHDKGVRLADAGAVHRIEGAETYYVDGDHGSYLVTIWGQHSHCTCPATGDCSHISAASLIRTRERMPTDPFASL